MSQAFHRRIGWQSRYAKLARVQRMYNSQFVNDANPSTHSSLTFAIHIRAHTVGGSLSSASPCRSSEQVHLPRCLVLRSATSKSTRAHVHFIQASSAPGIVGHTVPADRLGRSAVWSGILAMRRICGYSRLCPRRLQLFSRASRAACVYRHPKTRVRGHHAHPVKYATHVRALGNAIDYSDSPVRSPSSCTYIHLCIPGVNTACEHSTKSAPLSGSHTRFPRHIPDLSRRKRKKQ